MVPSPIVFQLLSMLVSASTQDLKTGVADMYISGENANEAAALEFLNQYNELALTENYKTSMANWNYKNNLTEYNKDLMLKQEEISAYFAKEAWKNATSFAWKQLFEGKNKSAYRSFKQLSILGDAALSTEKFKELNELTADMSDIYAKASVCPFVKTENSPCNLNMELGEYITCMVGLFDKTRNSECNLDLEPDLTEILKIPGDYEALAYYWVQFRDETGKKMKKKYLKMVALLNEAARLNGFSDAGAMRREAYESDTFAEDVEVLWQTLKPLYEQLHAYVRRKLMKEYEGHIRPDGPIPAHLLGNMWSQQWGSLIDLVNPYPDKAPFDVTDTMIKKKMTSLDLFKTAEDFFKSLGLIQMPPQFWNNTVMDKPTDRDIICHASAWDMFRKEDVRIKMCTRVNMQQLITIHHEMGHVEYYLQYADQPVVFRTGANPGFHEAVGDTLALSASTPGHLNKIGLLEELVEDEDASINDMLRTALDKIAFLPFGYLMDAYRWKVFDGSIRPEELNSKWWEMRLKYQGLCPPVLRTEADFDPGAKYHTAADVPYVRYFVSFVVQFQFHKALCKASGHQGPLHKCDIYRSKVAGTLLSNMLKLGSSVHWGEAMRVITQNQTDKMDAGPLMEYFGPLLKWLEKQNENEFIGWKSDNPSICPKTDDAATEKKRLSSLH